MIPLNWLDHNDGCSIRRNSSIAHNNLYPNAFCHQLSAVSSVKLRANDVLAGRSQRASRGEQKPGYHRVQWNGLDDRGKRVASDIYFYRMQTEHFSAVRKMIMVE